MLSLANWHIVTKRHHPSRLLRVVTIRPNQDDLPTYHELTSGHKTSPSIMDWHQFGNPLWIGCIGQPSRNNPGFQGHLQVPCCLERVPFCCAVIHHIPHGFSSQMKQKSEQVKIWYYLSDIMLFCELLWGYFGCNWKQNVDGYCVKYSMLSICLCCVPDVHFGRLIRQIHCSWIDAASQEGSLFMWIILPAEKGIARPLERRASLFNSLMWSMLILMITDNFSSYLPLHWLKYFWILVPSWVRFLEYKQVWWHGRPTKEISRRACTTGRWSSAA